MFYTTPLEYTKNTQSYTKEKNVIGGTNTIAFKLATGWGKNDEVRKKTFKVPLFMVQAFFTPLLKLLLCRFKLYGIAHFFFKQSNFQYFFHVFYKMKFHVFDVIFLYFINVFFVVVA